MLRKITLLATTAMALNACATLHAKGPLPEELVGIWESNGYGYVVAYDGERPQLFQHTGTICQPMPPGEGGPFGFFDTFEVDANGARVDVRNSLQQHNFQLMRRNGIPASCSNPPANTPLGNFDAFAAYMESHYGFFDIYGIDWRERVVAARDKVTDQMNDATLFSLFENMLDGINDAHLKLSAKVDGVERSFSGNRGKTEGSISRTAISKGEDPRKARRMWNRHIWENSMASQLLNGEAITNKSGFVQYGMVDKEIGYVSFFAMGGYSGKNSWNPPKDLKLAHKIMNEAISHFEKNGARAVIIDNSINHGGFDIVARAVASHFTSKPTMIYSKSPLDAKVPYQSEIWNQPADGKKFLGPVYLLTSDVTVSAGEVMTMALRSQPHVIHSGEKTRGALSDSLSKYLPNGWELSLSNEEYRDHVGKAWEGSGIEPALKIPVFGGGDIKDGHYRAVRRLVEHINRQRNVPR